MRIKVAENIANIRFEFNEDIMNKRKNCMKFENKDIRDNKEDLEVSVLIK